MNSSTTLYHYASNQTAFAIFKSRIFRLSCLSAANDSLEGRVLGRVFAKMLQSSGLPKGVVDVASVIVEGYPDQTEGFALCLSEKGDLLSQWRAYADNGAGMAIGFRPEILEKDFGDVSFGKKFFELKRVEYGELGLEKVLSPLIKEVKEQFSEQEGIRLRDGVTREQALRSLSDRKSDFGPLFSGDYPNVEKQLQCLLKILAPLHFLIYDTKPTSFHEECEWRLLRYRHRVALPEVEYDAGREAVRAYISCLIADPAVDAVSEVILGPKNRSDINWVRAFLQSVGLPKVSVLRSGIESYR